MTILMERLKHVYESQQFSRPMLEDFFTLADQIRSNPERYQTSLAGKIMIALFYEPSTRTRMSFESAMLRLGGEVIGTENASQFSSAVKGESLADTIRVVSPYGHTIVLRHTETGSAERASKLSRIPIINAGDGSGQHPTQALLDVYTIQRELKRLDGLKIALVGDLTNGRTARSLTYLCSKFDSTEFFFVSHPELAMNDDIKEHLEKHGVTYHEGNDLSAVLPEADVVYMTRPQKERMSLSQQKLTKDHILNTRNIGLVKPNARIMHPLPHTEEIQLPEEVEENDPRVAYFRQAENGLYIRMALLHHLLAK